MINGAADSSMMAAEADTSGKEKLKVSYEDMTIVLEKKDDGLADVTAYGPGSAGTSDRKTIFAMHVRA